MSLVQVYKALGDESRLRILKVLLKGRYNVNELQEIMDMGQSRVSRHLKLLTDAGLIRVLREGTWAYYEAPAEGMAKEIAVQLEVIRAYMGALPGAEDDEPRRRRCLDKRREKSRAFHDRMAPQWSHLRKEILGSDVSEHIISLLKDEKVVVDLGCGAGELLSELALYSGRAIGVDSSPAMLEQARVTLSAQPINKGKKNKAAELRLGTLEHLPLADAEADAALLNMVLHHLADPLVVLQEIRRVLSKKGKLLVCDLSRHDAEWMREKYGDQWLGFTEQELRRFIRQAGFKMVTLQKFNESPRPEVIVAVATVSK